MPQQIYILRTLRTSIGLYQRMQEQFLSAFLQEPQKTERHLSSPTFIIVTVSIKIVKIHHVCSTSVVYTSDFSDDAIPGMDFEFQNITDGTRHFMINFTISAGSIRSFPLAVIDDNVAEFYYDHINYDLGIYDSGQQLYCDYIRIYIGDDEGRLH